MYVYFIRSLCKKGFIKIGVSNNPELRLNDMQTGNPYELKLEAKVKCNSDNHAYRIEKHLHRQYKRKRVRGEWFREFSINHALREANEFFHVEGKRHEEGEDFSKDEYNEYLLDKEHLNEIDKYL